jgi:hypothetical protein
VMFWRKKKKSPGLEFSRLTREHGDPWGLRLHTRTFDVVFRCGHDGVLSMQIPYDIVDDIGMVAAEDDARGQALRKAKSSYCGRCHMWHVQLRELLPGYWKSVPMG